jgi:two-component system sensor histidine kinase KdpD
MLTTILEEAEHLNQIVSNLLDLARVRAGALVPSKQEIFIEDVIAGVLRRMRRRLEGMPLRTVIRPGLPPVHADPVQIAQVFSNLLENAVRFSAGKELQITAARWESVIRVTVTDHGPGILHEDRERVFEEFFRRDAGKGRGGSGLGLAIARAIVVAHGGRISVEGAPGGGTAVAFELPVARVSRREDDSPARKEVLR